MGSGAGDPPVDILSVIEVNPSTLEAHTQLSA